jgi:four helix bundle protein
VSWNHEKFKVFELADALVVDIYRVTADFPAAERYGLQSQIRRAAVSVPTTSSKARPAEPSKISPNFSP